MAHLMERIVPEEGNALVLHTLNNLLHILNDLLGQLSDTGATTMFCGHTFTLLSRVLLLGERSGVDLRGEYGLMWDGLEAKVKEKDRERDEEKDKAGAE